jgi:phosphoglycolate phosphatase
LSAQLAVRAVLIDLDGTLLETGPDIVAAANRMLVDLGLATLPEARVSEFIGKGVANLVTRCLRDAHSSTEAPALAAALALFERHYLAGVADRTRPYPGVVEGLELFARMGMPLGCVTNKAGAFTTPLLERTGLARYFRVVVAGDTVAYKKPHPMPLLHAAAALGVAPASLLLIGDSANDVAAARAAGCPVFVVPYGYREGLALEALAGDRVVADLVEAAGSITMAA